MEINSHQTLIQDSGGSRIFRKAAHDSLVSGVSPPENSAEKLLDNFWFPEGARAPWAPRWFRGHLGASGAPMCPPIQCCIPQTLHPANAWCAYPENPSAQTFWLVKEQESAPLSVGHSGLLASGSPARLPVVNATHDFFNIIGLNLIDHAFYTPLILV